jgi:2'-5' RNA ligase
MEELVFPLRSAFAALPLEESAKWQFQALQEELRPFEDFLKFQNSQTPHLTLYFWATMLKIEHDAAVMQMEKIAARTSPFIAQLSGCETFGRPGDERVLVLSVAFSPELATLKKLFPWPNPPDQPFRPHVTVARIGHAQKFAVHRKRVMKAFEGLSIDLTADRIRFYSEVNGHSQTPLQDFAFGG